MIITPATITALNTGFKANFQAGLGSYQSQQALVATTIPSTTKSNTYGWLGQFPQLREWVGDRVLKDMEAHGYTITNKDFEGTVSVKRTDIEDDEIGIYNPLFTEMGRAAAVHPDQLVFALLAAGFSTNCYDGQFFFDTDHDVGGASVSNLQAGTSTPWFLLDTSRALKPLIFQSRKSPELVTMTRSDDEQVFTSNLLRYGVDMRCNVGFGFWQMAFGSKAALDKDSFEAAYAGMQSFKSDEGRPLGTTATLLVVPPTLRAAAEALVAPTLANGATNPNANLVKVLSTPWLA